MIDRVININKRAFYQIMQKNPEKYSRTFELFNGEKNFMQTMSEFKNTDKHGVYPHVSNNFLNIYNKMRQEVLPKETLEKFSYFIELMADYITKTRLY